MVLIVLYGASLRSIELLNKNPLFGFDQGRDYLAVSRILDEHKLTLIGAEVGAGFAGINGLFHGPFYYYFLAIPYIFLKGDPYGGVILMFFFGVSTLILSYVFLKRIFDERVALLTVYLFAVSPALEGQSRFVWNSHPAAFFIVIVFYLVSRIKAKPEIYFPAAVFVAGFIYNFQTAIAIPLILTIFFFSLFIARVKNLKTYAFAIVASLLAFSPLLIFQVRHDFLALRGAASYLQNGGKSELLSKPHLIAHVTDYWNNFKSTFVHYYPIMSQEMVLQIFFIILAFFGLYYLAVSKAKSQKLFLGFLFFLIVVSWVFFLFLRNVIWDYYLIHLHMVYMILFAYVLVCSYDTFKTNKGHFLVLLLIPFLLNMTVGSLNRFRVVFAYDYSDYGGGAKISGKTDAVDYVYQDAKGEPFNVMVFMPPIYTYPYDYLFQWYGKRKYRYVPGNERKGLLYLIIEPDSEKPWTYKGWLETVVVVGEVIKTETLPSGLIIQKRLVK